MKRITTNRIIRVSLCMSIALVLMGCGKPETTNDKPETTKNESKKPKVKKPLVQITLAPDKYSIDGYKIGDVIDDAYSHFWKLGKENTGLKVELFSEYRFSVHDTRDGQSDIICEFIAAFHDKQIDRIHIFPNHLTGYSESAIRKIIAPEGTMRRVNERHCIAYYLTETCGIPMKEGSDDDGFHSYSGTNVWIDLPSLPYGAVRLGMKKK